MKSNKQTRRTGKALFRSCLDQGRLNEERVRSVVRTLLERKPRGYFALLSCFTRLVKLELRRHQARIESDAPLASELQDRIRQTLLRLHGSDLTIEFQERPELLGGLRVQVGSDVYDGTVRAQLDRMAASFAAG